MVMSNQELIELVAKKCQEQRQLRGYSDARAIAHDFIADPLSPWYAKLVRLILRFPTQQFLYPNSYHSLEQLYQFGDVIHIWTQGNYKDQLWHFAMSRLVKIRKTGKEQKQRLSFMLVRDKITSIATLITSLNKNTDVIVFVDDKLSQLQHAAEQMQKLTQQQKWLSNVEAHFVYIRRTEEGVVSPVSMGGYFFHSIDDITEIISLRNEIGDKKKFYWLIDLGKTLLDSKRLKSALYIEIANFIETMPCVISPLIDCELGLHGKVVAIKQFERQSQTRQTLLVTFSDGQKKIIKCNYSDHERILRENQGYDVLSTTPLGPYMSYPEFVDYKNGVLVLPYIDGHQLRQVVKNETLPDQQVLKVFAEILNVKKTWWSQQVKHYGRLEVSSVQRYDWKNTLEILALALAPALQESKLSLTQFMALPIMTAQAKQSYSLDTVIVLLRNLLENMPEYTVLTHGDLSGANILLEANTGNWYVIDPEYADYGDPAESYVKLIKYETTNTVQKVNKSQLAIKDGKIYIDVDIQFSNLAYQLQEMGLSAAPELAMSLRDHDFLRRVKIYLAGTYLREAALTINRCRPDLILFAIARVIDALNLPF